MAMSSVMAPRVEIYIQLAWEVHGPKSMIPDDMVHASVLSNIWHGSFTHIISFDGELYYITFSWLFDLIPWHY